MEERRFWALKSPREQPLGLWAPSCMIQTERWKASPDLILFSPNKKKAPLAIVWALPIPRGRQQLLARNCVLQSQTPLFGAFTFPPVGAKSPRWHRTTMHFPNANFWWSGEFGFRMRNYLFCKRILLSMFSFNRQAESYNSFTNTHSLSTKNKNSSVLTQLNREHCFSSLPGVVWLKVNRDFPVDWLHYTCPQPWWAVPVCFSSL